MTQGYFCSVEWQETKGVLDGLCMSAKAVESLELLCGAEFVHTDSELTTCCGMEAPEHMGIHMPEHMHSDCYSSKWLSRSPGMLVLYLSAVQASVPLFGVSEVILQV